MRELRVMIRSADRLGTPASHSLIGGTISPSSKTLVAALGIDPGTARLGYGVIQGGIQPSLLDAGVIGDISRPLSPWERLTGNTLARRIFILVLLGAVWQGYAVWSDNPLMFPTLSETLTTLWTSLVDGQLLQRCLTSLRILLVGYAVGIAAAAEKAVEELKARATAVNSSSEIAQVATVSSRDPEVGEMVAGAMDKVGKDGVVTVEESQTIDSAVDVTEGISFDKGYLSPYFATEEETYHAVLDDAAVLLVRNKISSLPDFLPLLEKIAETNRPTLIIAEDIEGEPLQALVVNSIRKVLKVAAVKAPYFGERRKGFMDDLAVVTGATVIDPEVGVNLNEAGLDVLGSARRVTITKDDTVIVDGGGTAEAVEERREHIRRDIERTDSTWDKEKLEERLAKLSGGVAVIRVGAATETEVNERKLRVEDAINAARAAVEEGVIAGGGSVLVQISKELESFAEGFEGEAKVGVLAVARALTRPAFWIAENAGLDGAVVVSRVAEMSNGEGFNANTLEYGNLIDNGIIDPVKVTHSAVVNATSVARMVLTTEASVVEKPQEEQPADAGHGHQH